jgi:hypothetical protein
LPTESELFCLFSILLGFFSSLLADPWDFPVFLIFELWIRSANFIGFGVGFDFVLIFPEDV